MKGDFTRFGFDSSKHFRRVLQQQGRVALDSDGNEASAILLHQLRTLVKDVFGAFGGPPDSGFSIAVDGQARPRTLWISPGHYWVDGILVENEKWTDYATQPDYQPTQPDDSGAGGDALLRFLHRPDVEARFWVYLDVWERHVTWIEDDSIREPALGGPDTCSRAQVVWQVKALPWDSEKWGSPNDNSDACGAPLPSLQPHSAARLAAQVDPGQAFTDACIIAPDAAYRGAENHLYRVEVHTGGDASTATFKWSRENGSVATRWLGNGSDASSLVVKSSRGFSAGDWVELSHDALDLAGLPGQLVKLSLVDGDQLAVDATAGAPMAWSAGFVNPEVRRWDQRGNDIVPLRGGAVPVTESSSTVFNWIDLEDGVQVAFEAGGSYRSGDYWLIPARVATQGIDWPQEEQHPALRLAQGIEHAYAPLGVLSFNGEELQIDPCRSCAGLSRMACIQPSAPVADNRIPTKRAPAKSVPVTAPHRPPKKRRTG
jgi:uncharacterized protein DUF6519